jgi:putative transcriptional regulator
MDGVCYALAVRDGGLRFTGLMGVVQRLIGQ